MAVLIRTRFGLDLPKAGLINYAKHYFVKRKPLIDPKHLSPILMCIGITDRCNLNCPWCAKVRPFNSAGLEMHDPDMKPEVVERFLNTEIAKRLLIVTFMGGEPLLNENIGDMIRIVKRRRLLCAIITNGLLLADKISILLDAGLDEVQMSIHDHNNAYETLRKIIPPISKKIPIHATYVLTKTILHNDQEHLHKIIQYAVEMGCSSFRFNICVPETIGGSINETIFDDDTVYQDFIKKQSKIKTGIPIYYPSPIKRHVNGIHDKNCRFPWQRLQINNRGDCSMCCYFLYAENKKNFLSGDAMETYNHPVLQDIRTKLLARNNVVGPYCNHCLHLVKSYTTKI